MLAVSLTPATVASPCVNVCRMHAGSGWCEGCLRTIDEIAAWSRLDGDTVPPRILICGSLYLAGQVLAQNG